MSKVECVTVECVTVEWEMWPSLLSHLGLTMTLCLMGGVLLFFEPVMGHHISSCRVYFHYFPLPFEIIDLFLHDSNPLSCICFLDSPFASVGTTCLPLVDLLLFLLVTKVHVCISCDKPSHLCHLYCVGTSPVVTHIGFCYDFVHPWLPILPLDCYCRPFRKDRLVFEYHCPYYIYFDRPCIMLCHYLY